VTDSASENERYVEIEKWDDANETAWLWVKVPSISNTIDTDLYLYYDKDHADNIAYVGDPNSTPAENVWDSNFKLVTHMRDDPDTSHIRDSTENNNDGTKNGAGDPAVTTSGKIDDAQDFDGVNDYVAVNDNASLDFSNALTISGWFYFDGDIRSTWLIAKEDASTWAYRLITLDNGVWTFYDGLLIQLSDDGETTDFYVQINNTLADYINKWVFLAATYNGSTLTLYRDATDIGHADVSPAIYNSAANLRIRANGAGILLFKGLIDEVRLSNTGRTAAWIKASYESERDDLLDWGSEEYLPSWDSYSDSGHNTACDNFTDYSSEHTAYMFGQNLAANSTYRVIFWDWDNNTWQNRETEDPSSTAGGNLSAAHTFVPNTDTGGDWHCTVYNSTTYSPTNYSSTDPYIVTDDTSLSDVYAFHVEASAIPEFPTLIAAIGVAGLCFGIYYWMRRKRLKFKMQKPG